MADDSGIGEPGPELDPTQLDRYSRHIIMDEIGPAGQRHLMDGDVLVVGAGGLGAPVLQYLAAAGVGTLGIADPDVVERSNLHRQVIHGEPDIGRSKVESADAFIRSLNPDVDTRLHPVRVQPDNVNDLLDQYEIIVDASDNFATRYLLNDAARIRPDPVAVVHGAVYRFEGQATTLKPGGPCYRCLFPQAPEPGEVPDCASTGVLGVLPGVIGGLQATEAVKLLLDIGEPLGRRLLFYDALEMSVDTVPYERRTGCPICGSDPIDSIDAVSYEGRCEIGGH